MVTKLRGAGTNLKMQKNAAVEVTELSVEAKAELARVLRILIVHLPQSVLSVYLVK